MSLNAACGTSVAHAHVLSEQTGLFARIQSRSIGILERNQHDLGSLKYVPQPAELDLCTSWELEDPIPGLHRLVVKLWSGNDFLVQDGWS